MTKLYQLPHFSESLCHWTRSNLTVVMETPLSSCFNTCILFENGSSFGFRESGLLHCIHVPSTASPLPLLLRLSVKISEHGYTSRLSSVLYILVNISFSEITTDFSASLWFQFMWHINAPKHTHVHRLTSMSAYTCLSIYSHAHIFSHRHVSTGPLCYLRVCEDMCENRMIH